MSRSPYRKGRLVNQARRQLLIYPGLLFLGLWVAACSSMAPSMPVRPVSYGISNLTPTPDRLATPVLPANPSQEDLGRYSYYFNCMPCHGDQGQGLTDDWRQVWEEDHQNCWAHGCHGGRTNDEGFPIPTTVPAVMHTSTLGARFPDHTSLLAYLQKTHPPQHPGTLDEADYQSLTAFLFAENSHANSESIHLSPTNGKLSSTRVVVGILCILIGLLLVVWIYESTREHIKG